MVSLKLLHVIQQTAFGNQHEYPRTLNAATNHPSFGINLEAYSLGEVIGQGTVGTIYRGIRKADQFPVAIKLLLPGLIDNELVYARFQREMVILEDLNHPNIVRYYGGGYHDQQPYFVMELVEGGSLKELLATQGALSWQEVVAIGRQLASALQHAHNHGVIHRDIKPSNLLITRTGQIKLTDFGIAKNQHSSDLTESGMTVGSHLYMPPEQITGERNVSGKSDLYSMGCLLFELLVQSPPFTSNHFAELFEKHLKAPPPSVRERGADCPKSLDDLIRQLMAKQSDARPFSARQVQGTLIEIATESAQTKVGTNNSANTNDSTLLAPKHDNKRDVGAEEVFEMAAATLSRRLNPPANVQSLDLNWGKLAIALSLVAGAAALLWFLNN